MAAARQRLGYTILLGMGMTMTQRGYAVGNLLVTPDRVAELTIQFMNISQGQSQLLTLAIASAIFQTRTFAGLKEILADQGLSDDEIRPAIIARGRRSAVAVLDSVSPELRARSCVDVIVDSFAGSGSCSGYCSWCIQLWTVYSLFLTRTRFVAGPDEEKSSGSNK